MRLPLEMDNTRSDAINARWRNAEPFVYNKRGLLIHRPRRVTLIQLKSKSHYYKPHLAVRYRCGASVCGNSDSLVFMSQPDDDALLCEACEARAVMAGLPSAAEITGRHVHIGKLKAVRAMAETQMKLIEKGLMVIK